MADDKLQAQRDFSAGEIEEGAARRDDTDILRAGAMRMRNVRPTSASGFERKPGSRVKYWQGGWVDKVSPVADVRFDIIFQAGVFRAINLATNAEQVITGCPWDATIVRDIDWDVYNNSIIVVHQTMRPRVLEYDDATGEWSLREFAFRVGPDGTERQPFYRFATKGITIQPDDDTGSITVIASDDVFVPDHVGVVFTYIDRQFRVTAYVSPTQVDAIALESLYQSRQVNVASNKGYDVGDAVEGSSSFTKGIVARKTGAAALFVVVTNNFDSSFTGADIVVGPTARSQVSGESNVAPEAIHIWDEAFLSDYRGWPGAVSSDRQRLIFCDFAQLPHAILWSAIGDFEDMKITADADGAMLELLPQYERVRHVVGGPDEFVISDEAAYFIPISADTPLAPGSVEFRDLGKGGASAVKPVSTNEAIVYSSNDGKRILAIAGTGQQTRPYILQHVSRFHSHLIRSPVALAVSQGSEESPGEDVFIVNNDGTLAIARYDTMHDWAGFFLWEYDGVVKDVASDFGEVILSVEREGPDALIESTEVLDDDLLTDGSVSAGDGTGQAALLLDTGEVLMLDDDTPLLLDPAEPVLLPFAGLTLLSYKDGFYNGEATVGVDGLIAGGSTAGAGYQFGFGSEITVIPFTSNFDEGRSERQRLRKRKINQYAVTVRSSGIFKVGNRTFGSYKLGEDQGVPPPLRNTTHRGRVLGRAFDPELPLVQPIPAPLSVLEWSMEVTS